MEEISGLSLLSSSIFITGSIHADVDTSLNIADKAELKHSQIKNESNEISVDIGIMPGWIGLNKIAAIMN